MQATNTKWFLFKDDKILFEKTGAKLNLLLDTHISDLNLSLQYSHKIGNINNEICYCAEISRDIQLPPTPFNFISLREALELLEPEWFSALARGLNIVRWDRTHQFCGQCGKKTILNPNVFERLCPHCLTTFYPKISPAIIICIKRNDSILMARSPHFKEGVFGLIAGFIEPGESAEDAAHREVYEEVGIKIKNLRYFGSQYWPFPNSLMLAYTADYLAGEINIDKNEIEIADWYQADCLPGYPSTSISIARKLIDNFLEKVAHKKTHEMNA